MGADVIGNVRRRGGGVKARTVVAKEPRER